MVAFKRPLCRLPGSLCSVRSQGFRKVLPFLPGLLVAGAGLAFAQQHRDGYKDTPMLPGQPWHVHDSDRPYPPEVVPGAQLGDPPSDAVILFDGKDLSHWVQYKDGAEIPARWTVNHGCIENKPGTGDIFSKEKFGDCQLHVEWREAPDVQGEGQGRGNSGVFMMGKYEIQILDSYRHATYADGQAGAIYGQWPPLVNPQRPPGQWQTYDVVFHTPRWNGDTLVSPAYETVFFNGVVIHDHQKLNGPTGHAVVNPEDNHDPVGPIGLQDHAAKQHLRFRNIWVRPVKDYDQP